MQTLEPAPDALAAHVLRPDRAALLDSVACALDWSSDETARRRASTEPLPLDLLGRRGLLDPQEAWEAMVSRGLVPMDATVDWRFLARRPGELAYPATVREAVALASDGGGLSRAVALGNEVVARLTRWGGARANRVVFAVDDEPRIDATLWPAPLVALVDSIAARDPSVREATRSYAQARMQRADTPRAMDLLHDVRHVIVGAAAFASRACDPDARIPDEVDGVPMPASVRGARHAGFDDPYTPMLTLLDTGYVLRAIVRDACVMVAPGV